MTELGKLLQQTRKKKKYSLDKVNKLTRISLRYIKALEESDSSVFPAELYHKSSLKNYAKFLELDTDEVLEMYEREKSGVQYDLFSDEEINRQTVRKDKSKPKERKKVVAKNKEENKTDLKETNETENEHEQSEPENNNKNKNTKKVSVSKQLIAILLLFVCFFVVMGVFVFKNNSIKQNEQKEEIKAVGVSNVTEEIIEPGMAEPKQVLEIEAERESWIRIFADGNQVFEGILNLGQKQKCLADDNFTIRIGNVDNVKVLFNGKPADILTGAKADRTNTLTFKKDTEI